MFHNRSIRVVFSNGSVNLKAARQFDEEFYVVALVQALCESAFHVGVIHDVLVDGALHLYRSEK